MVHHQHNLLPISAANQCDGPLLIRGVDWALPPCRLTCCDGWAGTPGRASSKSHVGANNSRLRSIASLPGPRSARRQTSGQSRFGFDDAFLKLLRPSQSED
jgi:hypothetical protein